MMMNNPVTMLANFARSGGNPMHMMQQMAQSEPRMRQAYQMIHGKSPEQLRSMVENMARERGTRVEAVAQNLGLR